MLRERVTVVFLRKNDILAATRVSRLKLWMLVEGLISAKCLKERGFQTLVVIRITRRVVGLQLTGLAPTGFHSGSLECLWKP